MSKKIDKRKAKQKRLQKQRNIERNRPTYRFRLDVKYKGEWKSVRGFRNADELNAHLDETEQLRKDGVEIVEGNVINLRTGRIVRHIKAANTPDDSYVSPMELADDEMPSLDEKLKDVENSD